MPGRVVVAPRTGDARRGLLGVVGHVLDLPLGLVGLALALEPIVPGQVAGGLFGLALDLVFIHGPGVPRDRVAKPPPAAFRTGSGGDCDRMASRDPELRKPT